MRVGYFVVPFGDEDEQKSQSFRTLTLAGLYGLKYSTVYPVTNQAKVPNSAPKRNFRTVIILYSIIK